ncbi:MAG TPA: hypothetical protein VEP90_10860, partial [Methylomirabilota bacterium]|nr:hypothetical protein [Methylomirabilota bacterium]
YVKGEYNKVVDCLSQYYKNDEVLTARVTVKLTKPTQSFTLGKLASLMDRQCDTSSNISSWLEEFRWVRITATVEFCIDRK